MAKGDFCAIDGCINKIKTHGKICGTHKSRFHNNGHYALLKPKKEIPSGYVQHCEIHGYLTLEQIYIHKRGKYCRTCRSIKNKERKIIDLSPDINERKCGCCKEIKPLKDFSPTNQKTRWPSCRTCNSNRNSAQWAKNRYHLRKHYNLTLDQYNKILINQDNKCAICQRTPEESQKYKSKKKENNFAVDHCHKSEAEGIMAIRGLLCQSCNWAIGLLGDDIKILKNAIKYLNKEPALITKKV